MSADNMSNKGQCRAVSGSGQDEGLVRVIGTGALGLSVVKAGVRLYIFNTLTKLVPLLLLLGAGLFVMNFENLAIPEWPSSASISAGTILLFFAFTGAESALSGTFKYLAVVATGSLLLIDLGVSLAVLRLRQRDGLPKDGEFRLPFGPVIPLLSCAIVCWLLLQVPPDEAVSIAVLVGACVVIYAIRSVFAATGKQPKHR